MVCIDSTWKDDYSQPDPITSITKSRESSFCDFTDGYILVTGNITVKIINITVKILNINCCR